MKREEKTLVRVTLVAEQIAELCIGVTHLMQQVVRGQTNQACLGLPYYINDNNKYEQTMNYYPSMDTNECTYYKKCNREYLNNLSNQLFSLSVVFH